MKRVTAHLQLDVAIEVDAGDDPTEAVEDVLRDLVDHVDGWEPCVDGPHPDAVAWVEGGAASAPRNVELSPGASP